jgi:hypothetical protein
MGGVHWRRPKMRGVREQRGRGGEETFWDLGEKMKKLKS